MKFIITELARRQSDYSFTLTTKPNWWERFRGFRGKTSKCRTWHNMKAADLYFYWCFDNVGDVTELTEHHYGRIQEELARQIKKARELYDSVLVRN